VFTEYPYGLCLIGGEIEGGNLKEKLRKIKQKWKKKRKKKKKKINR
jgi:hypothetical protein